MNAYIEYLKDLNRKLQEQGVILPVKLDSSYYDLYSSISIMEQFLYFNKVLTICNSDYKIETLFSKHECLFTERVKREIISEFNEDMSKIEGVEVGKPIESIEVSREMSGLVTDVSSFNEFLREKVAKAEQAVCSYEDYLSSFSNQGYDSLEDEVYEEDPDNADEPEEDAHSLNEDDDDEDEVYEEDPDLQGEGEYNPDDDEDEEYEEDPDLVNTDVDSNDEDDEEDEVYEEDPDLQGTDEGSSDEDDDDDEVYEEDPDLQGTDGENLDADDDDDDEVYEEDPDLQGGDEYNPDEDDDDNVEYEEDPDNSESEGEEYTDEDDEEYEDEYEEYEDVDNDVDSESEDDEYEEEYVLDEDIDENNGVASNTSSSGKLQGHSTSNVAQPKVAEVNKKDQQMADNVDLVYSKVTDLTKGIFGKLRKK